jgi:hypothetical protein
MAGTLLAFDEAFPRKKIPSGQPILNTPGIQVLRDNDYPAPQTAPAP